MRALAILLLVLGLSACQDKTRQDGIEISDAWVRATVAGQPVGAAYLSIYSKQAVTLKQVTSPVADSVEIHSMNMQQGVVRMRLLDELPVPAKSKVTLAPQQTHLMLVDLKQVLLTGQKIPLQLNFIRADGQQQQITVTAPVKDMR